MAGPMGRGGLGPRGFLTDEEKTNTVEILNKIEDATQLAERIMLNGFTKHKN